MAHSARNHALIDELVEAITSYDAQTNVPEFRTCREAATKTLRQHRFGRTNQFEVQQRLRGLLERLYVVNNSPLAEALDVRLAELDAREQSERQVDVFSSVVKKVSREIRWKPEILSLLLHVAEQPAEKAKVEDLDDIRPRTPSPERLTWRDIVGIEEADEDRKWGTVGLDDDDYEDDNELMTLDEHASMSDHTEETTASSVDEYNDAFKLESLLIEPDPRALADVTAAQSWRMPGNGRFAVPIGELQAVREVLHMLLGLPSLLFEFNPRRNCLAPSERYYVDQLSSEVLENLLDGFASIGTRITYLRDYVDSRKSVPLLQTFSQCIGEVLANLDSYLGAVETSLVNPQGPVIVSLLCLGNEVGAAAEKMLSAEAIVKAMQHYDNDHAYHLLDYLYDRVCILQAMGDDSAFRDLASTFEQCLTTYLNPVKVWMQDGILPSKEHLLFIATDQDQTPLELFWRDAFNLKMQDGEPMAPKFIFPMVPTIFSAGKQVAFANAFGRGEELHLHQAIQSSSSIARIIPQDLTGLSFYADLVAGGLRNWIQSIQSNTSRPLIELLQNKSGLTESIHALASIYLSAHAATFQIFADGVFTRHATGEPSWANPAAIEYIARQAFSSTSSVDTSRLTALAPREGTSTSHQRKISLPIAQSIKSLAAIRLHYSLSPAVLNIIPAATIAVYQDTSTLLLQLIRAHTALARLPLKAIPTSALRLRQRIHHAVNTVLAHILQAGIASASQTLHEQMRHAQTIDEMIQAHEDFIARIQRRCLAVAEVKGVRSAVQSLAELACAFAARCISAMSRPSGSSRMQEIREDEGDSDADDDDDDDNDIQPDVANSRPLEAARLRQMHEQFNDVVMLVVAGLWTASRAGEDEPGGPPSSMQGEETWTMLAEELESSLHIRGRRSRMRPV